jgi:hypothetical protein
MQSGIFLLRYRTEMTDAGMQMPALVLRMPMPNYEFYVCTGDWRDVTQKLIFVLIFQRFRHCYHLILISI